ADNLVNDIKGQLEAKGIVYTKVVGCGAYCSRVRIHFDSSNLMWTFLKAFKGIKFTSSRASADRPTDPADPNKRMLWHGIDKTEPERLQSTRQQAARRLMMTHAISKHGCNDEVAQKCVGTNDYGDVILKVSILTAGALPIKVYEADKATGLLQVVSGAKGKLEGAGFQFDPDA
ncbi:unnamed protein product, partial [Prorocentrum cordatum]